MEQPDNQDSGTAVDQPDNTHVDELEQDLPDTDDADQDPDSQEQLEEEDEIEVDGKKFAMPKSAAEKLKAERLMHADYTQKTQAVAEERKAIAADRESVVRQQQEAQQYIDDIAEIRAVEKQLKEIDKLNLADYVDTDPQGVMRMQEQRRALEAQRAELTAGITQKQEQHRLSEQQNLAKQVQEAEAYLKREIPGWSNERSNRLQQYAAEIGLPADQVGMAVVRQPALAKLLHKAELFDQLEKKQSAAKPKAPVQEKPVTRITATRASAQRDPDKMPMEDWVKWRNEQRRKR